MKFEERVTLLCARALATNDEAEVQDVLRELRGTLHQHVERLRSGLRAAYSLSLDRSNSLDEATGPTGAEIRPHGREETKTWQQVVHELTSERDHKRALRLSEELSRILQSHGEINGQA